MLWIEPYLHEGLLIMFAVPLRDLGTKTKQMITFKSNLNQDQLMEPGTLKISTGQDKKFGASWLTGFWTLALGDYL